MALPRSAVEAGLINKEMHNSCGNLSLSIEKAQIYEESFAVKLPEYFLTQKTK